MMTLVTRFDTNPFRRRLVIHVSLLRAVAIVLACAVVGNGDTRAAPGKPLVASKTVGIASWYGADFEGKPMANGHPFRRHALTAASRVIPLGERVRVRYRRKTILVTITDRGPYVSGRIIDLSEAAAARLGIKDLGLATVEIERLNRRRIHPPSR
jgi:rare lipoprotein A